MFQKMLQMLQGGGGGLDINLDIKNATFLGGYYQEEATNNGVGPSAAYVISTNSDLTQLGPTYTSEYFNTSNYWDITINKPCDILYVRYGTQGLDSKYTKCKGGEKYKGNYGGKGKIMIFIFNQGGGGDINLDIKNATFLGGYYQEEAATSAIAYEISTNSDLTQLGRTHTSEYFNISNYWDITINKPCDILYVRYGTQGLDSNYTKCKGGEKYKGNYGGKGKIMIFIFNQGA